MASPIAFARALVSAAALVASDSVMISFGEKKPDNRRFIQAVRTWVEDALPPEHEETTVMVNELQCFEPV